MHRLVSVSVSVSSQLCGCQRIIATPRYFKSMGILDELEAQWNSEGGSGSGFAVASSSRLPSASSLSLGRADQRRFITTATTKTKTSTTTTKTAKTKSPNHKSKEYVSILNSIKDEANDKGQSLDASCPDLSEYPLEALQVGTSRNQFAIICPVNSPTHPPSHSHSRSRSHRKKSDSGGSDPLPLDKNYKKD